MIGRIHSIESFGTVDGPGIRYVIFTQGCLLRCQFCHNPDTWNTKAGKEMSTDELIEDIRSYLPYLESSNGGVTVSGGEPLLQIDFLIDLFTKCKNELGIHTAIDSSAGCFTNTPHFMEKLERLFKVTDLILLDLKQIDNEKHKKLTGLPNQHILEFARILSDHQVPVWIRHVLVPGLTDSTEDLERLAAFIRTLKNVQKIEVLPYHKLGVYKWENLGLEYPLEHTEPPSEEVVNRAIEILNAAR
ncbi:pyruvate formate-lyase-activating protein [Lysinibacillus sp. BW-2-10]|uniref:pyruvate formate-lyase-activating protein n=1 Tax=Lysinibacillus sp. BW-2-10 TaxID=2590030 RepID=UPI00117C926F|nr:pyruvate formate-lyase-activating protein [Lysinibacillus sp. BW-2-10]TSI07688.1 pyruvate formate lyase-activating protein [Lysinibacillus sp. BW-2-10]